ncbi:hypothetical protein ANCCAN_08533 [Ancylostoma caninum]|uniref:Uncharacterized protein n=1 Tax=Ancylostoma caninum TaxID=29170 RepID=A0A368GM45_ANCCA|nr:hypothetical protein ANCCAN_08533 [Ancylostoma caninum]
MEMRMLRWMTSAMQLHRICNRDVRERYGVVAIADKLRGAQVPGKRPEGRPKQRWLDTLQADLKLAKIHSDQAHERALRRRRISKADPAAKREER